MAGSDSDPNFPPLPTSMIIAAMFGITCINCGEIFFLIFYTFKRYTGLYFWSMIAAVVGTFVEAISNLFRLYNVGPNMLMAVLLAVGWWGEVTGQSLVLYSRLHLIVSDQRKIRLVLIMIITNFVVVQIPNVVLWLGWNMNLSGFVPGFNVFERVQLVIFAVQEFIISGLYIWEVGHGLKPTIALKGGEARAVVRELVVINTIVILLDISLIVTVYTGHLDIQIAYQPLVYSTKLKLEFLVLNKLVALMKPQDSNRMYPHNPRGTHLYAVGSSSDPIEMQPRRRVRPTTECQRPLPGHNSDENILIMDHAGKVETSIHGNNSNVSGYLSAEDQGIMKTVEVKQTLD
ncbi:hypothetical protein F5883DRAFT_650723 [Diaporthe sp. PMI_573]|nr:hypothetical protein F5883DRAFT_650723 [Diaporthaceae sp. PMI_573]